jgi:hypothetical protein
LHALPEDVQVLLDEQYRRSRLAQPAEGTGPAKSGGRRDAGGRRPALAACPAAPPRFGCAMRMA